VRDDLGGAQAHRVDVEEADRGILQLRVAQDVAEQVLGKDRAAGADKADFGHKSFILLVLKHCSYLLMSRITRILTN
jgi:hypothetical protein